jgi:flagellar biosynthesis protein FlhB
MAELDDGIEERTEEASQKRRDDWKQEGRVAQSRELVSALVLFSVAGTLYFSSNSFFGAVSELFKRSWSEIVPLSHGDWSISTVDSIAKFVFKVVGLALFPIALASMITGIVATVIQSGFVWTTRPLSPNLDKINPMGGFGRIVSVEGAFEFIKSLIKFVIIGAVLYSQLGSRFAQAGDLWNVETNGAIRFLFEQLIHVLFVISGCMLIISLVDYGFQKFRFEQKIKMTRQEVREERKQLEGNPQIKGRIRALQRKVANQKMLEAVKKADVVITNPTHFAVALMYDRETMFAPKVVARGVDFMAQRIKQVARENGVPCVENVPLARALYKALKIGQFISRDLYNATAEVLAYVYRMKGKLNS